MRNIGSNNHGEVIERAPLVLEMEEPGVLTPPDGTLDNRIAGKAVSFSSLKKTSTGTLARSNNNQSLEETAFLSCRTKVLLCAVLSFCVVCAVFTLVAEERKTEGALPPEITILEQKQQEAAKRISLSDRYTCQYQGKNRTMPANVPAFIIVGSSSE